MTQKELDNGLTCIEHNNGDWNSTHSYTLYVVE